MHITAPERRATATQGWTLASANWLSVIATTAIAPVLPQISQHFASVPNAGALIGLVATIPAFFVAVCAWPAGLLADKFGIRRVLLFGVGLYGIAGCAPMVLDNLTAIIVTRASVGILEAIIMTCSTALVADYFHGDTRDKWLAVQTGGASMIATGIVILAGIMGNQGWRVPFAMYAWGFILFPLCIFKVWEPNAQEKAAVQQAQAALATSEHRSPDSKSFKWGSLVPLFFLTWFSSTAFYVLILQLGYILGSRGIPVAGVIGMVMAVMSVCMTLGAVIFKVLRLPVAGKLTISYGLSAIGFCMVALAQGLPMTIVGSCITGFGSGMVLPTLITWVLSKLPMRVRARGTGIWQSSFFLGQFASPQIVLFLQLRFGGISHAVLCYSGFMAVAAIFALFAFVRTGLTGRMVEAE
jgi:MFS family permease